MSVGRAVARSTFRVCGGIRDDQCGGFAFRQTEPEPATSG